LVRSMNTPARSTIGLAVDCQWTTSGLAAPTGIPGLDTIARCGFYRGGIHEVHGNPGAGKTNIVNQMLVMPRPARKPFSSRVD
jgi:RecA/RadA recombinase